MRRPFGRCRAVALDEQPQAASPGRLHADAQIARRIEAVARPSELKIDLALVLRPLHPATEIAAAEAVRNREQVLKPTSRRSVSLKNRIVPAALIRMTPNGRLSRSYWLNCSTSPARSGERSCKTRSSKTKWPAGGRPSRTIQNTKLEFSPYPKFNSLKKSLPLSSMTMKAGKFSTSMRQIASMPSSGYSCTSTRLMLCSARLAALPPMEAR
jgi:hypothetical protein